ncbi:MAG: toll/interleukin-1 receptor domain-containing protein [Candidatus Kryptoniota bacterium]
MKVFISWSGASSKLVAESLQDFLKKVIQATEPWTSVDIQKGSRWEAEIAKKLEESQVGIICLTRENIHADWILFEAGAISKAHSNLACTLLIGLKDTDIDYPLKQFQHTQTECEDIRKLVHGINKQLGKTGGTLLEEKVLDDLFDKCWPALKNAIDESLKMTHGDTKPTRPTDDILNEMLETVRNTNRRLSEEARVEMMSEISRHVAEIQRQYREKESSLMIQAGQMKAREARHKAEEEQKKKYLESRKQEESQRREPD